MGHPAKHTQVDQPAAADFQSCDRAMIGGCAAVGVRERPQTRSRWCWRGASGRSGGFCCGAENTHAVLLIVCHWNALQTGSIAPNDFALEWIFLSLRGIAVLILSVSF